MGITATPRQAKDSLISYIHRSYTFIQQKLLLLFLLPSGNLHGQLSSSLKLQLQLPYIQPVR